MPPNIQPAAITANTPGAIAYTAYGGRTGTIPYTAYRMPTAEESASSQLQAQISSLPADIQAKIQSGELVPNYTMVNTGGGHSGQGTTANGISGFYSPSANDTTTHYDLSGNQTSVTQNQHSGGGLLGGISDALAGLDSSLHLSQLAPVIAAVGLDYATGGAASGALSSIFGGAAPAAGAADALGTAGTTSAMAGGFGDAAATNAVSDVAVNSVIPAATTLTGDIAPLASAAPTAVPAATPLSSLLPETAPTVAPAASVASTTPLSSLAAPTATDIATPSLASTDAGLTSGAATAPAVAPTVADATTSLSQIANTAPAALTASSAPGSALAATTGAAGSTSAADLLAAGVGDSGQLPMALGNQAVASGMAPGSLGAQASAEGSLLPTEASAAYGTSGLGSLTGADAATAALGSSVNQAVASGMAPGEVGAAQSAAGQLTAEQLASASGTLPANMTGNLPMTTTNPSLLQQLQTATGLSGTQLASLLQGGIGAVNSSNISNAIGAGVNAQAAANAQSQGVLKDVYNTNLGFQQPYQAAGTGAVNQLAAQQPYLTHQFNAADLQAGLAPNYDFMLQQGQMANQRAANVGGGALSGNTLQGLQNYTQNYAGNAYQNAFNNYQTQRNNIYNSLAGIANIGQTANTGATTAGQNYGTGTVGLNTGLAGVQAAGLLGQAQAGASGATGLGNSVLLSSLLGQNPSAATTTPASQLGNVAGIVNTGTNLYNQFSKLFGG